MIAIERDDGVAQFDAVGLPGPVWPQCPGAPEHDMSQRTQTLEMIFKTGEPGSGEFQSDWLQGNQRASND